MAQTFGSISEFLAEREREFLLQKGRVKMKSSVENLEIGDYTIASLGEGETAELPRWIAEELVTLGLAENLEEAFETEVFRSLSREKMMGPLQLSVIPKDFYMKMKRRIVFLQVASAQGKVNRSEYDRMMASSYDLIGMRISKLLSLSSSSTSASTLSDKLTPEEAAFFSISQSLSKEWRAAILGGGK